MALARIKGPVIEGLFSVVPAFTEDNATLDIVPPAEREALITLTGIRYRRILPPDLQIGDLFRKATEGLLAELGWHPDTVDVFICVTQSPDRPLPSIACRLHGEMGWGSHTLCFDINSGCSGFVYGLYTVYALLAGMGKHNARAVFCCGDVSSRFTDPQDRAVRPVFSDAASAIGISFDEAGPLSYFHLQTDGSGRDAIAAGPAGTPDAFMRMNGIDIFNYSLRHVPGNVNTLLEYAGKDLAFPDLYVFHQANRLINESIRKKLGVPEAKVPYSLYEYGNTASATIPVTLGTAWEGAGARPRWVLAAGFGVGFSMASALIPFAPRFCFSPRDL